MSAKAEKLRNKFGGNMASIVGTRAEPAPKEAAAPLPDRYEGAVRARNFGELPFDALDRDESQPREEFDAEDLNRLAQSLRRFGQLAPIRVRRDESKNRWIVLVGERRLRACKLAGLQTVRVEFVERPMTEADILAEQVVENVARANLRPVEEARAYRRLIDLNSWTVETLAETLGVEPTTVHHRLGLLRLPEDVANLVDAGEIKATAAYEISKLQIADDQRTLASLVVAEGLDFKSVEAEVKRRRMASGKGRGGKARASKKTATIRTSAGKLTLENRRGVSTETWIQALTEALAQLRGTNEAAA